VFPISFGIKVDENWVFGVKNRTFRQRAVFARLQLATASYTAQKAVFTRLQLATASNLVTAYPFSCSCVFFTRFCFELAFGVNMKVLDNFVSFPMAFV